MLSYPQYGPRETYEPVIEALLASGPMQRLKGIHQLGVYHYFVPSGCAKRYEHSLGVMMLLRRFGASLEEQIAGLLHDVSHMAFSHVADYLFETWEEDFGERFTQAFVTKGEVAEILQMYGFDPNVIADVHQYGLLERERPDLCADRLDYSFRDGVSFGCLTLVQVRRFVEDLRIEDGQFVFLTASLAADYTRLFIELDRDWYSGAKGIASYFLMVDAMRAAFDEGVLCYEDLWKDDAHVMRRLNLATSQDVKRPLCALVNGFDVDQEAGNPTHVLKKKLRYVDPFVRTQQGLERISHIDASVNEAIEVYFQQREEPVTFSIIYQQAWESIN